MRVLFSTAVFFGCATLALANAPTTGYAVDFSAIGINKGIQVNNYIAPTIDGGGEFTGTLNGASAAFWCVDDQEAFYFGESGLANVSLLSQTATINSTSTHYGTIQNSGSPSWTNNGTDTNSKIGTAYTGAALTTALDLSVANNAAQRYTLAAYLVLQYQGFDTNIVSSNEDNAIQEAIWAITNTTTTGASIYETGFNNLADTTGTDNTGAGGGNVDAVSYWVDQALAHAGAVVNPGGWAVVSWGANSGGILNNGSYNDGANSSNQTFLVELAGSSPILTGNNTPEPGFYGALAIGLSGLFFVVRRRRKV